MTKEISLTHGKITLVNDEDYELLCQWNWSYDLTGGNARRVGPAPDHKTILMHRVIANTPPGMDTDHINGNKLDNRRSNLRICTHRQNTQNRGINKNSKSGIRGVYWIEQMKKWRAVIKVDYKPVHIGYFADIKDAAHAVNEASKKYRGEFARLNPL